jgi:hypothetical protein
VTKLSYHPAREDLRRLRERWDAEDAGDLPLQDFDTTLTSGLDDTVRHLQAMRQDKHCSIEAARLCSVGVDQLATEVRDVRNELASMVVTLNRKASKGQLHRSFEEFSAKLEKRVDNIFKMIAALGVVLGILITIKGHV